MATVMLVDDRPDVLEVVGRLLGKAGFEVHGVLGGKECLESFEQVKPDILLVDVMMPEMGGWELVRALKDRCLLGQVKIAMLTVVEEPPDENADLGVCVLDYIKKPFEGEELVKRVKRLDSL